MLLLAATGPVLAQSKKEVLKKAIAAYKENPNPPFKGYSVHVSPLLADSAVTEYYHGFRLEEGSMTKYYYSNAYKAKITLDSSYSYWYENQYLHVAARSKTKKQLYEQTVNMEMPPTYSVPLNKLAQFYLRKKKAVMMDTLIDGEPCYRFEIKIKDSFDPITGMKVTGSEETITISWQTGLIREYAFLEKWDGDIYKMYYRFYYLDDPSWKEKVQIMDSTFASNFVNYVTATKTTEQRSQLVVGDTIQYWHFKQLGSDSIDIRTLNLDYYVLDFWYTSCGPCVGAIPNNNRLDSSIRQYNAQVLGITNFHKSDEFLEAFKEKRSIHYTLFTYSGTGLESHFPVMAYPTYILVNKDGCILHIGVGSYRLDYKQEIEDLIKANALK